MVPQPRVAGHRLPELIEMRENREEL